MAHHTGRIFHGRSGAWVGALMLVASLGLVTGCKTAAPMVVNARSLGGAWDMDLSPRQDGTYIKDLVIVATPPADGTPAKTFTGTVYDGFLFENGLVWSAGGKITFAFVSDEGGEQGGPYYWVGTLESDDLLTGRVQSLKRGLLIDWSARRKPAGKPVGGLALDDDDDAGRG